MDSRVFLRPGQEAEVYVWGNGAWGQLGHGIQANDRGSANLVVDNFLVGGKNFLAGIAHVQGIEPSRLLVELYYTGLSQSNGTSVLESWRLRQGTKTRIHAAKSMNLRTSPLWRLIQGVFVTKCSRPVIFAYYAYYQGPGHI